MVNNRMENVISHLIYSRYGQFYEYVAMSCRLPSIVCHDQRQASQFLKEKNW